ncbi:unnamed protein product, partial [Scytosiphon promiscuus]
MTEGDNGAGASYERCSRSKQRLGRTFASQAHKNDRSPDRDVRGGCFFQDRRTTAATAAAHTPRRDGGRVTQSRRSLLWERGLDLERRREAGARSREEARQSRASAGHVNARSAELVRAMRVRSLVQTYRTLLASVEYARLPEGLDYDEAMESITAKINAIFDNDNDAWQEMKLEVAKADPTVLKPELVEVVTAALARLGDKSGTLSLFDFCELLDASVENLVSAGGPTAHLFAPVAANTPIGLRVAARAAAIKAEREDSAELREMTFHPSISKKSTAIAKTMGRNGTKTLEDILRREKTKSERRRNSLLRQKKDLFSKQCPFRPTLLPSSYSRSYDQSSASERQYGRRSGAKFAAGPRYSNEIAADQAAAATAAAAAGTVDAAEAAAVK